VERHLAVTCPDGRTKILRLNGSRFSVGRAETNDIACTTDASLSRSHMALEREGDDWFVCDLGSKNGVFVNGVRTDGRVRLRPGDQITAGRLLLVYDPAVSDGRIRLEDPAAPESIAFTTSLAVRRAAQGAVSPPGAGSRVEWLSAADALLRAGKELSRRRPLPELFRVILDLALEASGASRGALLTCERGELFPRAVRGDDFRLSAAVRRRVLEGRESLLILDTARDSAMRSSQSILAQAVDSLMAVPVQTDERVIGMLYLDTPAKPEGFTAEDLNLLTVLANVAAVRIESERLAEMELADQILARELEQAAEIQRYLLPQGEPEWKGLDLAGCNVPCRTVGGDYYGILPYADGRLGLAIGDVAGKGMPAALLMSCLQAKVTALAETGPGPGQLVSRLNRSLTSTCPNNRFITFFFCCVRADGGMIYSNAGHSPPLLAREDGHVLRLEAGGPVLGVFHGAVYAEHSCVMEIGDLLLMYSDGVTEGSNPAGEEFGEERLEGMLREAGGRTARQVVSWVMETVNEWSGGQPLADDVTLLAARRTG